MTLGIIALFIAYGCCDVCLNTFTGFVSVWERFVKLEIIISKLHYHMYVNNMFFYTYILNL